MGNDWGGGDGGPGCFRKTAVLLAGVLAVALLAVAGVSRADAAPTGWTDWLVRTGTVCVQKGTQTYWPVDTAVRAWNATDASMVAKVSCAGYSRAMTVIIRGYSSSSDGACAKFNSPGGFTWAKVRGAWVWVPNTPTIWVNNWSRIRAACQNTARKRLYLMSHELGHVFGLSHATGITVMRARVNETYILPTRYDVARLNRRY